LFKMILRMYFDDSKDKKIKTRRKKQGVVSKNQRYISAPIKRKVFERAKNQCEFKAANGKRCSSKFNLQLDHIRPVALGGLSKEDNLRLLCREHNLYMAKKNLGDKKMSSYLEGG